jgi:hypothetical protein
VPTNAGAVCVRGGGAVVVAVEVVLVVAAGVVVVAGAVVVAPVVVEVLEEVREAVLVELVLCVRVVVLRVERVWLVLVCGTGVAVALVEPRGPALGVVDAPEVVDEEPPPQAVSASTRAATAAAAIL